MITWLACSLIETLELVLNAADSWICCNQVQYRRELDISRNCSIPCMFSANNNMLHRNAILLCHSCHKFQCIYFIYSLNFDSIIIASQPLYQGYKIVYLSSLAYLTIFLAWMFCGQSGTRSDFSPVFTFSIIRPMKTKLCSYSLSLPLAVYYLSYCQWNKMKQFSLSFWVEEWVK